MSKTGFFVTFEGGEGTGKTTQINTLAKALTEEGRSVLTTREPGGTPEGEKIRNLIVQRDGGNWTPLSECLLLFSARAMHVEKVIRPALADGNIVICDRFTDSTRAYQGYAQDLDLETIEELNRLVLGDFEPDLTFIMDMDPADGIKRSERRLAAEEYHVDQLEDRFENLDISFHEKLRAGYLEIAGQNKKRCRVIDAAQDQEDIFKEIKKIILQELA